MPLDIVVGAQWGDEGKGRVVDLLAAHADIVARYNGGDNAGHTVTVGERTFKLHLLPSGMIQNHTIGALGNGVVINPAVLIQEMEMLRKAGLEVHPARLRISFAAHVISSGHRALDKAQEEQRGAGKIGTTLRGIGPAYAMKVARSGMRMENLLFEQKCAEATARHADEVNYLLTHLYQAEPIDKDALVAEMTGYARQLAPYIGDVSLLVAEGLANGKRVLAEGAQGTLLDLDHGTYPYVTSSNPTAPGALVGLGVGPNHVNRIIGVTKAFQTRVGEGPFPTEVFGETALRLRGTGANPWDEFGTTTGRPRRVGWLDMVLLRYALRVNGITELTLTKLDILSGLEQLSICSAYNLSGQTFQDVPYGPSDLEPFSPICETLPGWQENIQGVRKFGDLPQAAQQYIRMIEELSGIPVVMASVGPERDQVIRLKK